jgi:hypothetical protein
MNLFIIISLSGLGLTLSPNQIRIYIAKGGSGASNHGCQWLRLTQSWLSSANLRVTGKLSCPILSWATGKPPQCDEVSVASY